MVRGLDIFKRHFAGLSDRYVLIGGTASTVVMGELGGEFRATKDLDIVLFIEALDMEFAETFWSFIRKGEYDNLQKSKEKRLFYRFSNPADDSFPEMIELFSRVPDAIEVVTDAHLTPIPVSEDVSSLSAILLKEGYCDFIKNGTRIVDSLPIIGPECLIPLKAKAYIDLSERKAAGESIDSKDIKKHKNDIFRLFTILDPESIFPISKEIKADMQIAFEKLASEKTDLRAFGIRDLALTDILNELSQYYGVKDI